jgi:hypothetical protein
MKARPKEGERKKQTERKREKGKRDGDKKAKME